MRVDLILQEEQRSASLLTPKMIMRIASIVTPLIILVSIGLMAVKVMGLSAEAENYEREWIRTEPKQAKAIDLAAQLNANRKIREELDGWRKSQMLWHPKLASLPKMTPKTIQILDLNVDQVIESNEKEKTIARSFVMQIRGKATGKNADLAVDEFEQNLRTFSEFAGQVDTVEVVSFTADNSKGASEEDRLFEIRCKFLQRLFK